MNNLTPKEIRYRAGAIRCGANDITANLLEQHADLLEQIERAKDGVTDEAIQAMRDACPRSLASMSDAHIERGLQAVAHLLPRGEVSADWLHLRDGVVVGTARPDIDNGRYVRVGLLPSEGGVYPTTDPVAQIDTCTELNCPRCRTHPDHRGDMEHAGIGSRPTADPVAQGEAFAWATPGGDVSRSYLWCTERCRDGRKPLPLYLAAQPRVPDVTDDLAHWIIAAVGDIPYSTLTVESVKAALITAAPLPKEAKS